MAKYVTDDYIFNIDKKFKIADKESLWSMVPLKIPYTYVKDPKYVEKMKELVKENIFVNPLFYKGDNNPMRFIKLKRAQLSQFKKFK